MSVSSGSSNLYAATDTALAPSTEAEVINAGLPDRPFGSPKHGIDDAGNAGDTSEKRIRLSSQPAGSLPAASGSPSVADDLPAEIWQHVLSYLNPPELGRAMRISKSVLRCLDGSIPAKQCSVNSTTALRTVDSEVVWASWRISHPEEAGNMPKPLDGHTERDMWRLIRGMKCDVCEKRDTEPRKPISPDRWHGGPTMSTTRAVWSFALRMCGECLYRHCEKVSCSTPSL